MSGNNLPSGCSSYTVLVVTSLMFDVGIQNVDIRYYYPIWQLKIICTVAICTQSDWLSLLANARVAGIIPLPLSPCW